jgi:hypothetical protein
MDPIASAGNDVADAEIVKLNTDFRFADVLIFKEGEH